MGRSNVHHAKYAAARRRGGGGGGYGGGDLERALENKEDLVHHGGGARRLRDRGSRWHLVDLFVAPCVAPTAEHGASGQRGGHKERGALDRTGWTMHATARLIMMAMVMGTVVAQSLWAHGAPPLP